MAKVTTMYEERPIGLTLELTMDEAQAVYSVLRVCGGALMSSRRMYTESVYLALASSGFIEEGHAFDLEGELFFKNFH